MAEENFTICFRQAKEFRPRQCLIYHDASVRQVKHEATSVEKANREGDHHVEGIHLKSKFNRSKTFRRLQLEGLKI